MDRFDEMRGKSGGSGSGGNVIIPPEAGNLTKILVTKMPNKLDYLVGDSLNTEGLEVTAYYDNNVTANVTSACILVANEPLKVSDSTITVKYETVETTFEIKVYAPPKPVPNGTIYLLHLDGNLDNEITSSSGTISTYKTTKYSANKFGEGLAGNGSDDRLIIANDVKIPTVSELKAGATLTAEFWYKNTYSTDSTLCDVFSIGNSIRLQCRSSKRYAFGGGTSFEGASFTDWVHIALVFSKGSLKFFTNGKLTYTYTYTSSNTDNELRFWMEISTGTYLDEVLVSTEALYTSDFEVPTAPYGGKRVLERLTLATEPTKTDYAVGETFSLAGAVINATYSDGTIIDVTSDCVIESSKTITAGMEFVEISYTYEGVKKTVFVSIGIIS